MKRLLLLLVFVFPVFGNAAVYSVGIVSSYGDTYAVTNIKNEISDFVSGSKSAEVTMYQYTPAESLSELDSIIAKASAEADIVILYGEVPAGRSMAVGINKPSIAVINTPVDCGGSFTNLIYPDINFKETLDAFRDLLDYESVKVISSKFANCKLSLCAGANKMVLDSISVPYELVNPDVSELERGDVAILMPQPQMNREELRSFLSELADKGVLTVSFGGYDDAELGVLAVNSRDRDQLKISRSAAVAVADIINGKRGHSVVHINRTAGLVINMETALKADFSPTWKHLRTAELVNYDKSFKYDKYIGFKEALMQAVAKNEDVATGRIDLETAKYMVEMSRSAFKPTISLSASAAQIDEDRARIARGTAPEKTVDVAVELQQIIYSEQIFSLKDQARYQKKAAEVSARQAELDVMDSAAKAYLQVLRAKAYLNIAQDNLETTKYNYDLARNRDLAGAANPAELHRWEATIALSKIDMVNASNSLKMAMTELARVVGEDIDGFYRLEDVSIEKDYSMLVGLNDKGGLLSTPKGFNEFKKVMVEKAVENSVELKALGYLTDAADRSVLSAKRKYYMPTVAASGEYKKFLDKSGEGDDSGMDWYDDKEWSIGIKASIPLYEGGLRSAKLSVEKASLRKLYHQRARAEKLVRQRMIAAMENARSAYDSYKLAGESAEAAEKTLAIVADLYAKGAVSITELIDAQNAKLKADMNEAENQYSFMEKVVEVERAYGHFFAFSKESDDNIIMNIINNTEK